MLLKYVGAYKRFVGDELQVLVISPALAEALKGRSLGWFLS